MTVCLNMAANSYLVEGYTNLAQSMSLEPEKGILRRFSTLNIQDLLYRQAEIVVFEDEVRQQEPASSRTTQYTEDSHVPTAKCAVDWWWLGVASPEHDQWKKVLTSRKKLEDYSD